MLPFLVCGDIWVCYQCWPSLDSSFSAENIVAACCISGCANLRMLLVSIAWPPMCNFAYRESANLPTPRNAKSPDPTAGTGNEIGADVSDLLVYFCSAAQCKPVPVRRSSAVRPLPYPVPYANHRSPVALDAPEAGTTSVGTLADCRYAPGSVVAVRWYSRPSSTGTGWSR